MIDHETALAVDFDVTGVLCEFGDCMDFATHRVVTSTNAAHDGTRDYCDEHYEAYMIGVQHGRYHEAARLGGEPGRDDSQGPPQLMTENQLDAALSRISK